MSTNFPFPARGKGIGDRGAAVLKVTNRKVIKMNPKYRWLVVVLFAAAMAWVEAAVVLYLRILIDRLQPY